MSNRNLSHEFSSQDYDLQRQRKNRFDARFQPARKLLTGIGEPTFHNERRSPAHSSEVRIMDFAAQSQLAATLEQLKAITELWSRAEQAAFETALQEAAVQAEPRVPGKIESAFNTVVDYIIVRLAALIPKDKMASVMPLILSIAIPLAGLGMETGTAAAKSPDNVDQATTTTVDSNEQAVGISILLEVNRIAASILEIPGGEPVVVPPKGSLLTSTGEKDTTNTWIKVKTADGKEGWIRIANVTEVKQQTPVSTLEATKTTTDTVETATLQNFYTPDQDQNVRSSASVTGTVVGSIKTGVAIQFYEKALVQSSENGKEYNDLWFRIGENAWVAFVYHGRQLGTTSQVEADNLPVGGGAEGLNVPVLIDDYNKVAATLGLSETVAIMQVGDGSLQYLNAENEVIAVARPVIGAQPGEALAELFSVDASGNPDIKLGEDMGDDAGWKVLVEKEQGAEVVEVMTMEEKLLEVMEKNSDVFPESLLAEVKKLKFDENRGGWIVDKNHVYIPVKTSSYGSETKFEEGIVWLSQDGSNTMVHSVDGATINIGTLPNAKVENLQWQYDQAATDAWIELITKEPDLKLAPNITINLIIAGDMTQHSSADARNPEHLPVGGRRNIESMVIPLDNQFSAQIIKVLDKDGNVIALTCIASQYEKEMIKNPQDVLPSSFANYAFGELITTLIDQQQNRLIRDNVTGANQKRILKKIASMYQKNEAGQYVWPFKATVK